MEPTAILLSDFLKAADKVVSPGDRVLFRDNSGAEIATAVVQPQIPKGNKRNIIVSWGGKDYQSAQKFAEAALQHLGNEKKISGKIDDRLFLLPSAEV